MYSFDLIGEDIHFNPFALQMIDDELNFLHIFRSNDFNDKCINFWAVLMKKE